MSSNAISTLPRIVSSSRGHAPPGKWTARAFDTVACDFAGAIRTTDDLVARMQKAQARPMLGLYMLRGDAMARVGRDADAEAAFREEIRQFPGDVDAYRSLIVLLVAQGRTDEGTRVVLALAKQSPNAQTFRMISETLRVVGDENGARYWRARAAELR